MHFWKVQVLNVSACSSVLMLQIITQYTTENLVADKELWTTAQW